MSGSAFDRLAGAYGIQPSYLSEAGRRRVVSDTTRRAVLEAMGVAAADEASIAASLFKAPDPPDRSVAAPAGVSCHMPAWLAEERVWGITCQLYGLASDRNHGIGDFEDLAVLAEVAATSGADFIGINPVHALFTADSDRCSPYSPSNRRFLNPLYIAIDRIPGLTAAPGFDESKRRRMCAGKKVDYPAVGRAKLGYLADLWRRIVAEAGLWTDDARDRFDRFVAVGGEPLRAHTTFEALSHVMAARGLGAGWHSWPEEFRNADSAAVKAFATEHAEDVGFHLWLQWIADAQLGAAASRARAAGMRIGLYLDFAVGNAPDGSATWFAPALVVSDASVGAPPDTFFSGGQDWGLAPLSPAALRARDFTPFRDGLASVMRHAGAVRIDHVMNLHRLFWVPRGMNPDDGCYVLYPLDDMLRALAQASNEHRTIVIGEDLGTVPVGFREMMGETAILSYRVLYFEWSRGAFRTSASYGRNAFLTASTHDLPPLSSWWAGKDIGIYVSLGTFTAEEEAERHRQRMDDRRALLIRLAREAARRRFAVPVPETEVAVHGGLTPELASAIHAYLARSPSRLLGIQFEDMCGADAPVNVPGTSEEYPNWQLRAPLSIEDAPASERWQTIVRAVSRERPKAA